jgi:hypothetical protein
MSVSGDGIGTALLTDSLLSLQAYIERILHLVDRSGFRGPR